VFVSKLDLSGNFVWVKQMAATNLCYSSSLAIDKTGNVYTTGAFSGTVDFDPGPGVYNLTSSGTSTNIFINKMTHCTADNAPAVIKASACSSYKWNCQDYTASGIYTQTFINAGGCDSIVTLDLTIQNSNLLTTVNATACGSYIWKGQTLTSSGVYKDTIATNGCDSIVTLQLEIRPIPFSTVNKTICQGQSFEGHTTSGIYNDTLIAANGCDSIRKLQLTVL